MRIALTGGIACGKTLVARFLNEFGVETIDADDIVHELLPDPAERRRIAAEVFADPEKRRALEAKLHPQVKRRIEKFLGEAVVPSGEADSYPLQNKDGLSLLRSGRDSASPLCVPLKVAIIPLLFETHWDKEYDIICCVASDRETQISRMMTTRGYTRGEAEARLAAQLPVEAKAAKSHYVIENNGSAEELKEKVRKFRSWLMNSMCSQGR